MGGIEASTATRARGPSRSPKCPSFRLSDLLFGLLLPLTCFLFDAGLGLGIATRLISIALPLVAFELILIAASWVLAPKCSNVRAALAGALAPGAICAGAVGLFLLPLSILGTVYVIGLLGFVPLITCFVFARASRAWLVAARGPEQRDVLLPYAAGFALALLPLVPPVAGAVWTDQVIHRVVTDETYAVERAAEALRWVPDGRLDAIVTEWGSSEDPRTQERLADLHEALGRGSVESRWYDLTD
jgi:hypothetical protein